MSKRKTTKDQKGMAQKRQATGGGQYKPVRATVKSPYVSTPVSSLPAAWQPTGSEIKAIDLGNVNYFFRDPATATGIALINGIQAGTGFFNRIGARVEMKSLHLRGVIQHASVGAGSVASMVRLMVVYDRQPTGSLPTASDIILSRLQTGATVLEGESEINLDNRDRFIIVRDKQIYVPNTTNTAAVETYSSGFPGTSEDHSINMFIKLKGLGTHFKSTSNPTTISDIASGALYLFTIINTGASDNYWLFNGSMRLRYEDK